MEFKKELNRLRKQYKTIDDYLIDKSEKENSRQFKFWVKQSKALADILMLDKIDILALAALADIIYREKDTQWAFREHSRVYKENYRGADQLYLLLKNYLDGKVQISNIRFDFKNSYNKAGELKSTKEIKSYPANSIDLKGEKVISPIMELIASDNNVALLKVFKSYLDQPLYKPNEFANKETSFNWNLSRKAHVILLEFFDNYKMNTRHKKIAIIQVLIFIKLLPSYDEYSRDHKIERGPKKKKNEYYLRLFSDLFRKDK